MLYFIVYTKFFEKSSLDELRKAGRFKVVKRYLHYMIIEASSSFLSRLERIKPIFVYSAAAIESTGKISEKGYLNSIYKTLKKAKVSKFNDIILESIELNSKRGYTSKDIEVYLGEKLEREGVKVNIADPKVVFYMILLDMQCYVGHSNDISMARLLNPLRYPYSNEISRAEQKLKELLNYFVISPSGIVLDIGAAPGGWSYVLAKKGAKVIAVDSGELDSKGLEKRKLKLKVLKKGESLKKSLEKSDIVHIKLGSKAARSIIDVKNISMIVDDTNIRAKDSANAVMLFSKFLAKDAKLIMTVKCVTRKADKYINEARKILERDFVIRGIKALPSNRQEVMLYATRK